MDDLSHPDLTDEIPPLLPPDEMPAMTSPAAVHGQWRALMGPLGFDRSSLWTQLIGPDRRCVGLVEVDDLPRVPHRDEVADIVRHLAASGGPDTSLAFLLARPGVDGLRASDLAWARTLLAVCAELGLRCEPVHVACDAWLVPVTPDDLAA